MNGLNRFVARCECNRPTLDSIQAAGFEVTQLERSTLKKAPAVRPPAHRGYGHHPASCPLPIDATPL